MVGVVNLSSKRERERERERERVSDISVPLMLSHYEKWAEK